jgi:hypothetical protein
MNVLVKASSNFSDRQAELLNSKMMFIKVQSLVSSCGNKFKIIFSLLSLF